MKLEFVTESGQVLPKTKSHTAECDLLCIYICFWFHFQFLSKNTVQLIKQQDNSAEQPKNTKRY